MNKNLLYPSFIITGTTNSGLPFLPNDWAERLYAGYITLDSQYQSYHSPYVHINHLQDIESLVVEHELWEVNPEGYEFLVSFARKNDLEIIFRKYSASPSP